MGRQLTSTNGVGRNLRQRVGKSAIVQNDPQVQPVVSRHLELTKFQIGVNGTVGSTWCPGNTAPTVANPILDQTATAGTVFIFELNR